MIIDQDNNASFNEFDTTYFNSIKRKALKLRPKKRSYTEFLCFETSEKALGRIKITPESVAKLGIVDRSIVECSYDAQTEKMTPIRVRWDKTKNNQANYNSTALDIWDSIEDEVTEKDLQNQIKLYNKANVPNPITERLEVDNSWELLTGTESLQE